MTRRSLRHPVRGDRRYLRPSHAARKAASRPRRPRMRPRRNLNVAALVASPEEQSSRPNVRLVVVGLFFLVLLGVMILRLWSLQVIQAKSSAAAVVANQVRTVPVPAPRGVIVDRNERILVGNNVEQQIVLSRHEALVDPGIIGQVAALVGTTPGQVRADLNSSQYSPYQGVPILTGANAVTVQYLAEHQAAYPGVSVQQTAERTYPQGGTTAPGILGYVTNINATELKANRDRGYTDSSPFGQAGLEGQYEHYLAGVPGEDRLSVNVLGNVVRTERTREPVEGDTVVTNIDLNLQNAAQSALANAISSDHNTLDKTTKLYPAATSGAAVVMNVQTGAVLALASYPSYNLNEWVGGISANQFASIEATGAENDYAIQGLYPPGSTFKLVTATAALQSGIIGAGQYVYDGGAFTVPNCNGQNGNAGCVFNDDEAKGAGEVNIVSALTQSDDYYFYNLGYLFYVEQSKYGATPIQNVAAQYGLGVSTGIDLPDEAPGRVDSQAVRRELHKEDPDGVPVHDLVRGGQHRDGVRPGRHRRHPDRGGGRLRHLRQRRHPLRARDRGGHRQPGHRQGREAHRAEGDGPRGPAPGHLPADPPGARGRREQRGRHRLYDVPPGRRLLRERVHRGREDRHGRRHQRHCDAGRPGARRLVRGLRAQPGPEVRGRGRDPARRLRGPGGRPGRGQHLQLPGGQPDRAGPAADAQGPADQEAPARQHPAARRHDDDHDPAPRAGHDPAGSDHHDHHRPGLHHDHHPAGLSPARRLA